MHITWGVQIMTLHSEDIQMNIYQCGDEAAKLLPVSFDEWEDRARKQLAAAPFGYVYGAAGSGDTHQGNVEAFQKYRLRPRVCCDTTKRDLSISIFGCKFPVPFLLAPIGVNTILHPDGELAPARAAAKSGVPYILSNVSSISLEEVAKEMGESVRWFQLYPPKDHELTKSFLQRADVAGFSAIVVTVDSHCLDGARQIYVMPICRSLLDKVWVIILRTLYFARSLKRHRKRMLKTLPLKHWKKAITLVSHGKN